MRIDARHLAGLLVLCAGATSCSPPPDGSRATADTTAAAPPVQAAAPAPASPRGTATGRIGGASVTVDYGRPSRRGRQIFGALVPYGRVWRTGANSATTLVLGAPIQIQGKPLDAGSYTLYSVPSASGWTLVINGQTGQWGTEYNENQDVLRVPLVVARAPADVDTFTITIDDGADAGRLVLAWDTLQGVAAIRPR